MRNQGTMKYKILVVGFFLGLLMSGCIVYYPQTADVPLISGKNDLRVDAGISLIPSANATISYGLTDKIAIQGFGSIGADDVFYLQAAAGLYKRKINSQVTEIYGGVGYGKGTAYNDANPGHLLGNYQLYYGQFNYGKIANERSNLEFGIGFKTGYLHSNFDDRNYYNRYSETGSFKTYHDESLLIEPLGFIRLGGDKLKFSVKLGGTWIYKFTNTDKGLPYSHVNLGLGINYRL